MNPPNAIPHEDTMLCPHLWVDLYHGWGQSKLNHNLMYVRFYCRRCLEIRTRVLDMSRINHWLDPEEEVDSSAKGTA